MALWNGNINKFNFLVKPQVIMTSICSDMSDSVQDRLCCVESGKHPHTAEGNSVPAFTARLGLPVRPVRSSFLLVLNDSTIHLAVKQGLVVSQLLPLSPALTPSDHQL